IKLETAEELNVGDEILITGTTTGALQQTVDEIREDLKPVPKVVQGSLFSIKTSDVVRRGDKLYKIVDTQFANCE
ncbi:MAG: U32 family peptidase, partial [Bacteroidales bacterium]|nr:U32 family peptidase [Bacteroidales bacterium]